jgi:hypothetical protein
VQHNEIKSERDLVRAAPKPVEEYKDVALTSLTAYSLYWLHQWQLPRTIEAIAILNWRLFPLRSTRWVCLRRPKETRLHEELYGRINTMPGSGKEFAALALIEALIESGVAEKVGEDRYRWKNMTKKKAVEKDQAWQEANPDRAARFEDLISTSEQELPEA